MIECQYLLPANEVCEGYVFTPVCQSFCSQGGSTWAGIPCPWAGTSPPSRYTPPPGRYTPGQVLPGRCTPWAGTPPGQYNPLGRYTSWQCMLGYGQQAGSMHRTGMHSSYIIECKYLHFKRKYGYTGEHMS